VGVVVTIAFGLVVWLQPWQPELESTVVEGGTLPLPDKPSIAVLPFANMSDDPQQEFFADGITDDLITDLSRLSGLFVIAPNSTFVYKGKEVDVREVARELGVRYVLEGSVRLSGDRVRINAQLVDTVTGGHHWAERYDGSLADVFSMQDRVTNAIVDSLALRLTDTDRIALGQQETKVPAAYDAFLRGWEHYRRTTPEDFAQAIPYFEAAIELDPEYGRAYAAAAMAYARITVWRWYYILGITRNEARARARQFLLNAEKYKTALAYQAAGLLLESHWLHGPALVEFEKAILLEPGDSWSYAFMAFTLTSAGRPAEAIPHIRTAIRLDPHSPSFFMYVLGLTEFSLENFEAAAAAAESSIRLNPDDEGAFLLLASIYGHLGHQQDAHAAIAHYNEVRVARGDVAITISSLSPCSACPPLDLSKPADSGRLYEGLRLAGVSEAVFAGNFSAKNLLTASEVQALFFGHRLHGRTFESGEEHAATITADGVATLTGDWASTGGGTMAESVVRFEGDEVCFLWSGTVSQCGSVLRNPGGTRARENEFIWYHGDKAFTFSQVE
jgi:TolB-like protein/Tfp pilus assembly protein PilF